MAGDQKSRAALTTAPGAPFRTGAVPDNQDYQDLAASFYSLLDDTARELVVDDTTAALWESIFPPGEVPADGRGRRRLQGLLNRLVTALASQSAAPFAGLAHVVSDAATAAAIYPDTGRVLSMDGSLWSASNGVAAGTYASNGGVIGGALQCGTVIAHGDGSAAWVREYDGPAACRWWGPASSFKAAYNAASAALESAGGGTLLLHDESVTTDERLRLRNRVTVKFQKNTHVHSTDYTGIFYLDKADAVDVDTPHESVWVIGPDGGYGHVTGAWATPAGPSHPAQSTPGIELEFCTDSGIERIFCHKADDAAFRVTGYRKDIISYSASFTNPDFGYTKNCIVRDCIAEESYIGFEILGGAQCDVIRPRVITSYQHGVRCAGGPWDAGIYDADVQACVHTGLYMDTIQDVEVVGGKYASDRTPATSISYGDIRRVQITNASGNGMLTDSILSAGRTSQTVELRDNSVGEIIIGSTTDLRRFQSVSLSEYWRTINANMSGTNATVTVASFTVPNVSVAIRIILDAIISRAPASNVGRSRVVHHDIAVCRNAGAAVVADASLAGVGSFDVQTTTAGGANSVSAASVAVVTSGGATEPNVVTITLDCKAFLSYAAAKLEIISSGPLSSVGL